MPDQGHAQVHGVASSSGPGSCSDNMSLTALSDMPDAVLLNIAEFGTPGKWVFWFLLRKTARPIRQACLSVENGPFWGVYRCERCGHVCRQFGGKECFGDGTCDFAHGHTDSDNSLNISDDSIPLDDDVYGELL